MIWHVSKCFLELSSCIRVLFLFFVCLFFFFFLDTQCKYLIDLLILLDIFTLALVHIELPQFISYSSGFSIQVLVSPQRFGLLVSFLISCHSLYFPVSLILMHWFALWCYPSDGSKKWCWCFSLFSLLLLGVMTSNLLMHISDILGQKHWYETSI